MATERDLELLDDYLRNRLSGDDKTAFENRLQGDPELQTEFQFQQQLVTGLKNARVAELKAMLNNIPVSSIPHGGTSLLGKIAAGTIITGAVITGIYLFNNSDENVAETPVVENRVKPADTDNKNNSAPDTKIASDETKVASDTKKEPIKKSDEKSTTPVTPPQIEVYDPTEEAEGTVDHVGQVESQPAGVAKAEPTVSVAIEKNNKAYSFHYQFREGKLFLYGPFESNLYELMEFFNDKNRTIFLFYGEKYYLLKEGNDQIKPLTEITDPALISRLNQSRSK